MLSLKHLTLIKLFYIHFFTQLRIWYVLKTTARRFYHTHALLFTQNKVQSYVIGVILSFEPNDKYLIYIQV